MLLRVSCVTLVLLMPRCRKKPRQSQKPHQKVEAHPLEDLSTAEVKLTLISFEFSF